MKGIRSECVLETSIPEPEVLIPWVWIVKISLDSDTGYATGILVQDAINVQFTTQRWT